MNARNNVNGVGAIHRNEAYTGRDRRLQDVQEAFVRKVVRELNEFDNVYFEICNEPYFGGVTLDWQARIASVIVETENALPRRHLIAQNIANEKARIERPNPAVSIFNFHYATPPATVGMNYALGKAIADDETGFRGVHDKPYRIEAWDFLVAGVPSSTTWTTRSRPTTRTARPRSSRPRPAAAGRRSGPNSRCSSSLSKASTS
jgi:hypothetical protein